VRTATYDHLTYSIQESTRWKIQKIVAYV